MEKFTITNEKVENLKRKGTLAADIAVGAAMKQMGDQSTVMWAVGIGLVQGLKYNGSLKRGIKAGLATYGAIAGANAVMNVANNWDKVKRA